MAFSDDSLQVESEEASEFVVVSVQVAGEELAVSNDGDDAAALTYTSPALVPTSIEVVTSPASVEVGIDCGMPDMCGLDPCLCGAADAWGACACNGAQEIGAEISYTTSDASVVTVQEAFGRVWLIPHGQGEATITVTAQLENYGETSCEVQVSVGGMTSLDIGVFSAAALAVVLVGALVVAAIRAIRKKKASKEVRDEWDV